MPVIVGMNGTVIVSQGPGVLHNGKPTGGHSRVCGRQRFLISVLKGGLSRLRDFAKGH